MHVNRSARPGHTSHNSENGSWHPPPPSVSFGHYSSKNHRRKMPPRVRPRGGGGVWHHPPPPLHPPPPSRQARLMPARIIRRDHHLLAVSRLWGRILREPAFSDSHDKCLEHKIMLNSTELVEVGVFASDELTISPPPLPGSSPVVV